MFVWGLPTEELQPCPLASSHEHSSLLGAKAQASTHGKKQNIQIRGLPPRAQASSGYLEMRLICPQEQQ